MLRLQSIEVLVEYNMAPWRAMRGFERRERWCGHRGCVPLQFTHAHTHKTGRYLRHPRLPNPEDQNLESRTGADIVARLLDIGMRMPTRRIRLCNHGSPKKRSGEAAIWTLDNLLFLDFVRYENQGQWGKAGPKSEHSLRFFVSRPLRSLAPMSFLVSSSPFAASIVLFDHKSHLPIRINSAPKLVSIRRSINQVPDQLVAKRLWGMLNSTACHTSCNLRSPRSDARYLVVLLPSCRIMTCRSTFLKTC
ncbi:hypothetical protein B0T10DRAFT_476003 [Thelonectria olida]|uniref:Uncharacterized protein n=1 Tax=Thelonectria olida TaxID=1576542 RepID=A0A9P9AU99_9HYPO|nr:hypothetical protein B0T10DRAFT_476003 [Thelonectria olida]